ncbi:MAG: GNAT family N-acetyltransferase [Actinomycetota bacterium]|nr:GNAT family N-acetyltransferase [Actinomycetota bacterium]
MPASAPRTDRVTLRDGRVALVAPLHPDDRRRYLSGVSKMSEESLYKRFMSPVSRLTESQLRYLLEVDHRDHEALLAVDEDSGEAVGVARFIRLERPDAAEAAIIVVDSWQGSGLGKAMLRMLAEAARDVGVERFEANVLYNNAPMLALLDSLGPRRVVRREGSSLVIEVPLPQMGIGAHETGMLREVDSGEFELLTPADGLDQPS